MKKLYYMLLIAVISMTVVSCSNWDEPYNWDWDTPPSGAEIVGSWESYYGYDGYGEYDILGYDVVHYEFYTNRMGRYYFYSRLGLTYIDFQWSVDGRRLQIWYNDGDYEDLYFGFSDYGYLVLSTSRRFYQYTVYRPSGYYYEPKKSIDIKTAKCFDPATDEKPKTATMRAKES